MRGALSVNRLFVEEQVLFKKKARKFIREVALTVAVDDNARACILVIYSCKTLACIMHAYHASDSTAECVNTSVVFTDALCLRSNTGPEPQTTFYTSAQHLHYGGN